MKKLVIIALSVAAVICVLILLIVNLKPEKSKPLPPANLYITGEYRSSDKDTAYYMINDSMVILLPADASVSGIYYFNGDVYVSGIYYKDGNATPCYWKNGGLVTLPVKKYTAYTSAIFVNDKGVFVSGLINDGYNSVTACYWHNDSLVILPKDKYETCYTRAIFADDTNIYVAGYSTYSGNMYFHINACSWINNERIPLDTSSSVLSIATHILKADTNLYFSGRAMVNDSLYLSIWKDNVRTDMYPVYSERTATKIQIFCTFESSDFIMLDTETGTLMIPKMKISSFSMAGDNTYTLATLDDSTVCLLNGKPVDLLQDNVNAEIKSVSVCPGDTIIAGISADSVFMWRNNHRKGIAAVKALKGGWEYFFIGRD